MIRIIHVEISNANGSQLYFEWRQAGRCKQGGMQGLVTVWQNRCGYCPSIH